MTYAAFKQKLFHERPGVKKKYSGLEPEYQREVADIKQATGNCCFSLPSYFNRRISF
jgi:hypothetical protein